MVHSSCVCIVTQAGTSRFAADPWVVDSAFWLSAWKEMIRALGRGAAAPGAGPLLLGVEDIGKEGRAGLRRWEGQTTGSLVLCAGASNRAWLGAGF